MGSGFPHLRGSPAPRTPPRHCSPWPPSASTAVFSSDLPGEDPHGSGADTAVVGGTGGVVRGEEGGAARHAARTAARGKPGSIREEAARRGHGVEAARGGRRGIMRWMQRTLQERHAGARSGGGARVRGRRWRRSRGGRERAERGAMPWSSRSSDPKLHRAASPSSLPSMAGGRPLPRAAEQGPRSGAELLEDRTLSPSSSLTAAPSRLRPQRRSSSSLIGEPWGRSRTPAQRRVAQQDCACGSWGGMRGGLPHRWIGRGCPRRWSMLVRDILGLK